jgi:cellobiose epimerase
MIDPNDRALLSSIRERTGRLAVEVMAFWRVHGPDRVHGGFLGTLDRDGRRMWPFEKGLVQQARHLWAFSSYHAMKEPSAEIRAIADDLYHFIRQYFYSPTRREFYWMISESGPAASDSRKVLYGQAFAIYALATYGRLLGQHDATSLALETFRVIDARAHDDEHGGYLENNDTGYLADGSQKGMNTHLHLMEAYTALFEATRDEHVARRLRELAFIVATKIVQRPNYRSRLEFHDDWTPCGPSVRSWGHDLETSWLLRWTASALGESADPVLCDTALALGTAAGEAAWDTESGSFFEEGSDDGQPIRAARVWWVQCEALPALFELYRATGERTYLARLAATLEFIEKKQRDVERPGTEWFFAVEPDGRPGPRGEHKGEAWKASYHNLRALLWAEKACALALAP